MRAVNLARNALLLGYEHTVVLARDRPVCDLVRSVDPDVSQVS